MRSRTGCMTCRRRKLKCDETKPRCGQCCKANRECQFGSAIVFRHQQNASMNGEADPSRPNNGQKGFYAYKNTFDKSSVWLDIPKQITFVNTSNPYDDPDPSQLDNDFNGFGVNPGPPQGWVAQQTVHGADTGSQVQGLEALSTAALYVPNGEATSKPSHHSPVMGRQSPAEASTLFSKSPALHSSSPPSPANDDRVKSEIGSIDYRATSPPIDPTLGLSTAPGQEG